MEKEKEKANVCSPDTVLEDFLRSAESETSSSKASTSESEAEIDPQLTYSRWSSFFQLLRFKSKRQLASLHPFSAFKLSKKFSSMREEVDLNYFKPQWKNFSFLEIQSATNNFCQGHLIGKGGYAEVYKARLHEGQLVAIKRFTKGSLGERIGDFLSELGIMAHINHPNTAKLIGYGVEGGMYLVLEFSPVGSLASMLHSSRDKLKWDLRYKIALGTAKGLLYLHEGCQRRIIHRDIKAANILLTEDFEPQICDFGLAKWLPEHWTHLTASKCEGTFGYLAPEFLMHGIVDEKTDVFAFGVLLLELITGRRALDYSQQSLVMWAKPLLKKNKITELIDPLLAEDYNPIQMKLSILAASLCVQQSSVKRPQMSHILLLLRGNCGSLDFIRKHKKISISKKYYRELFSAEEHSFSARYKEPVAGAGTEVTVPVLLQCRETIAAKEKVQKILKHVKVVVSFCRDSPINRIVTLFHMIYRLGVLVYLDPVPYWNNNATKAIPVPFHRFLAVLANHDYTSLMKFSVN